MSDKESLHKAIAREEALFAKLNTEKEQTLVRLEGLKRELAALESACAEPQALYSTRTSQGKVVLFRSLFRGREDVFPKQGGDYEYGERRGPEAP